MRFSVDLRQGYLRAELFGRQTADEMREFLGAVQAACKQHGCARILMAVRGSRVIFKPDDYGLSRFAPGAASPACQIALLGDSQELHAAHEYIELVARVQQVNARAFRDEASALRWLGGSPEPGRRYRFTRIVLLGAPDDAGVYALWEEELVYYGHAMGSVRARLLEHFDGQLPSEGVSHYSWELCAAPAEREAQLLAEYQRAFGRPPRLNAAA